MLVRPLPPTPIIDPDTGEMKETKPSIEERGWIAEGAGFSAYGDTIEEAVDNHGARR